MKSRETLIRLKKFQVDEKRRKVAQIEGMIAEFERIAGDLDREIKTEQDRAVLAFLSADIPISRAYVTAAGTPPDRVAALRRAFDATMKDPALLAEAARSNIDISPSTGEAAQKFSDMIANTPPGVLARAKAILDVK